MQTAAQPNITSVGTLASINVSGTATVGKVGFSSGGKILDMYAAGGSNGGNNTVQGTFTVPATAMVVRIYVQGNALGGSANAHSGRWVGYYFASGNRIITLEDVNDPSQGNQRFVVSYSGGVITVKNSTGMAQTQSGDCVFEAIGY